MGKIEKVQENRAKNMKIEKVQENGTKNVKIEKVKENGTKTMKIEKVKENGSKNNNNVDLKPAKMKNANEPIKTQKKVELNVRPVNKTNVGESNSSVVKTHVKNTNTSASQVPKISVTNCVSSTTREDKKDLVVQESNLSLTIPTKSQLKSSLNGGK